MNQRDYALLRNKKKRSQTRIKQDKFKNENPNKKTNKEFYDEYYN